MKRSEINSTIETAKKVFSQLGILLPRFAYWSVEDWKSRGPEVDEIRKAKLGWDVTDFGLGRFMELGRTLFTVRNGYKTEGGLSKLYCEKIILDPEDQRPPAHFHKSKMEDIINRAGGNILIQLFNSTDDGKRSKEDFYVQLDGLTTKCRPGQTIRLEPGQSICLVPGMIHQFWCEKGTGLKLDGLRYTVSGEISIFCDDWNDNCFLDSCQRFPSIEENDPAVCHLCNEYPRI